MSNLEKILEEFEKKVGGGLSPNPDFKKEVKEFIIEVYNQAHEAGKRDVQKIMDTAEEVVNKLNMNFKTLLVEKKIFCPTCNNELHNGNLMFEDTNNKVVCGYCRDDYETHLLTGVAAGELKNNIKPWNGREAVVIDGHFDNPKREYGI